jgi:hypothetical protein
VPTKGHIEWPFVMLLIAIVLMVAADVHRLPSWVAFVILGAWWVCFAVWSRNH